MTAAYNDMKRSMQQFQPLQQTGLQQLLSDELGEQPPSQLLQRLRQGFGEQSSKESQLQLLLELFLQRLAPRTRMVLTSSDDMSLDWLASLAHCICDGQYQAKLPIGAARAAEPGDRLSRLQKTVHRLTSAMEKLTTRSKADEQHWRTHSTSQSGSDPRDWPG